MVITLGALLADVPHTPPGGDHRPRLGRARWSTGSASSTRATRARPGSSACSTTPSRRRASRRRACGRRCRTTWPPRPTRRWRWRWCAPSRASPAWWWTPASWRAPPRTTSARSAPPWPATPRSRRSSSGWRPRWTRSRPDTPDEEDLPSADTIARDFQRFLRQRGQETLADRVVAGTVRRDERRVHDIGASIFLIAVGAILSPRRHRRRCRASGSDRRSGCQTPATVACDGAT